MARRGSRFTLTDLCILLAVAALVFGRVVPVALVRTREDASRVKCASNLRQIGQAISIYAMAHKGAFPRGRFDEAGGPPTAYTGWDAADPFAANGPGPNDVTACLFLLLRATEITPDVFACPVSAAAGPGWDFGGKARDQVSNFPGPQFLTYSYFNSYAAPAAVAKGFKADYTLTSDFAVAADVNPGAPGVVAVRPDSPRAQMRAANSPNHNGDGQNVLYGDGHVEYLNSPFSGMLRRGASPPTDYRDNIYTFGAGFGTGSGVGVNGPPVDAADSVLLPTAPAGAAPGAAAKSSGWIAAAAASAGAAVLIAAVGLRVRRRWRRNG